MVIVNVQGFFVWVNEGQGLVVWEKGSLWPVMLIFYSSCQGLKQKNSLDLMSRNGSNSVLEESLERLKKQGPNVNRRKTDPLKTMYLCILMFSIYTTLFFT